MLSSLYCLHCLSEKLYFPYRHSSTKACRDSLLLFSKGDRSSTALIPADGSRSLMFLSVVQHKGRLWFLLLKWLWVIFQLFLNYLPFQLRFKFIFRSGSSYSSGHLDYFLASQFHVKETTVSSDFFLNMLLWMNLSAYILLLRPPSLPLFFFFFLNGMRMVSKSLQGSLKMAVNARSVLTAGSF